jgi:hypothetical protein
MGWTVARGTEARFSQGGGAGAGTLGGAQVTPARLKAARTGCSEVDVVSPHRTVSGQLVSGSL